MDKIAVLIPCYNEGQTIAKVVKDYREALPEATIYVYDNNSSDHTDEIAREAGAVVRYEYQQGKGNVIRSMFRDIDAECYVMTDGDDTYPAEDARKLADQILQGKADMVIGDRLSSTYFTENKRPFHNTGNRLVRGLINHQADPEPPGKAGRQGCREVRRLLAPARPHLQALLPGLRQPRTHRRSAALQHLGPGRRRGPVQPGRIHVPRSRRPEDLLVRLRAQPCARPVCGGRAGAG